MAKILLAAFVLLPLLLSSCGGGDAQTAPTATPSSATSPSATPTPLVRPSPAPTQIAPPTPAPKAADEGPRVVSMLVEFVAPGVAAVRLETDVETTALLSLFGRPGEANNTRPEEDKALAKDHTISIRIVGIRPGYSVTVKDKEGRQGTGVLERPLEGTDVVGTQFFGRGALRPNVSLHAGRKGTVTWTNLLGNEAASAGLVRLYTRPNTCTRAQDCSVTYVQSFAVDTIGGDKVSATHAVPVAFPDTPNVDYRLLVVGRERPLGTVARPISYFFQLDVPAASILK